MNADPAAGYYRSASPASLKGLSLRGFPLGGMLVSVYRPGLQFEVRVLDATCRRDILTARLNFSNSNRSDRICSDVERR
jgi:hypothetical protein